MRKALIILLALLLACTAGTVYAFKSVNSAKDKVVYTQKVLYGDPEAADGLCVTLHEKMLDHLLWKSELELTGGGFTDSTEFDFSPTRYREYGGVTHNGVNITDAISRGHSGFTQSIVDDLLEDMEPGESVRKTVRIADYLDYYPLAVDISTPEFSYYSGFNSLNRHELVYNRETRALKALSEYFRIPVLEDEYLEIDVRKDYGNSAYSYSTGVGSSDKGDVFSLFTNGFIRGDACYFWFYNRTKNGNIIDTSLIPDGYGVYVLPYGPYEEINEKGKITEKGYDIEIEKLGVFYPVDESVEIRSMILSEDEEKMLLYTVEDNALMLTVIDMDDASELQKMKLAGLDEYRHIDESDEDGYFTYTVVDSDMENGVQEIVPAIEAEEYPYTDIFDEDGFDYIMLGDERFLIVSEGGDGLYEISMDVMRKDIEFSEDFGPNYSWNGRCMAFDGERFAVCGCARPSDIDETEWYTREVGCGFFTAVYGKNGLEYYGVYDSSLNETNNKNINQYDYIIRPCDVSSVEIRWK